MEQFQLFFDERVSKLEKDNRWGAVVRIVLQQWNDCPNDLNRLLCAGTQLWYTLLVMDYIRNDPLQLDDEFVPDIHLQNDLMIVTRYGLIHFAENPIFNAYFGYMIYLMPYFFIDYNGDYLGWQAKGLEMMRLSYILDPDNPFTKAVYYEKDGYGKDTPFFDACREIWSKLTPEQWGETKVQQYFFRILHGESFFADAYL